ncbi:MAG: hypothetical protein JXA66_03390 [Oligoflexia bacterium]|nr:hypothetical protein [Oligoflexia bacterium]
MGLGTVVVNPTLVPAEKANMYNVLSQRIDRDYFLANLSPATLDGSIDSEPKVPEKLDRIIRKAGEDDFNIFVENQAQAQKAHDFCLKKIREKKLPMKLVKTEFAHNAKKVVIYFTSDGRVDFRELVKELLKEVKLRIELRQIDVRDETKLMGGVGSCGRELCCCTFLRQFKPVSIKMAKEQDITLNPGKVSGVCGRLLCCLTYELETYSELKKGLPKVGNTAKTPDGEGKIVKVNVFNSMIDVLFESGEYSSYRVDQIREYTGGRAVSAPDTLNIEAGVSEEELKALEDGEVVDIKDTFLKPASDDRSSGQRRRNNNRFKNGKRK